MTRGHMAGAAEGPSSGGRGTSVIVTVIDVLRCFTAEEPLQGVTEVAAKVGLHKSSASRILATLEQEGFVERDGSTRKYRLGLGLIAVAAPLLANLDVRRVALPVLEELARQTGETAGLVVWNGTEAVSVEQVPSSQLVKHTTPLGSRYATAFNASVQVFLASMDAGPVDTIIAGSTLALPRSYGKRRYLARLAEAAERGYAVNFGETVEDEVGIAAPVRDHRDSVVAAVLLAAPRYRVPEEQLAALGTRVADTARQVSRRLGSLRA